MMILLFFLLGWTLGAFMLSANQWVGLSSFLAVLVIAEVMVLRWAIRVLR